MTDPRFTYSKNAAEVGMVESVQLAVVSGSVYIS